MLKVFIITKQRLPRRCSVNAQIAVAMLIMDEV